MVDVVDDLLDKRVRSFFMEHGVPVKWFKSPSFLTPEKWGGVLFQQGTPALHRFYQAQRQRMGILMNGNQPEGGSWSFEHQNQKVLPYSVQPPTPPNAKEISGDSLGQIIGELGEEGLSHAGQIADFRYPVTREGLCTGSRLFLEERFELFGSYEKTLSSRGHTLFHSGLSPMLNNGLLTPDEVVSRALGMGQRYGIP